MTTDLPSAVEELHSLSIVAWEPCTLFTGDLIAYNKDGINRSKTMASQAVAYCGRLCMVST